MDNMLREFHLNDELHKKAIQHSLDKKIKLSDVYTMFQPESWDILTEMIENYNYIPNIPFEDYRDKKTGERLSYEQAMKQKEQGKKVRCLSVLPTLDRVIHNCFYKILYNRFEYLIHPLCVSYKKGIGTKNIADKVTEKLTELKNYVGIKGDLEAFFDSVPIEIIDKLFDELQELEPSTIWYPIIKGYHDDRIEINHKVVNRYMSLRQGNPIACILADLILCDIDKEMTQYNVMYYRYSDDFIIIGDDEKEVYRAYFRFVEMLNEKGIKLNKGKTEYISDEDWFEFLGFSFKKDKRSVSEKTLRNLKIKIKSITTGYAKQLHRPCTEKELKKMIQKLQRYFFTAYATNQQNFGMGVYLFGGVNVEHDLIAIENYIKDCLRACSTNHYNIYGLGYVHRNNYVIDDKNLGQNIKANNEKTKKGSEDDILKKCGWVSLIKMYNDYHTNINLFENSVYRMSKGLM